MEGRVAPAHCLGDLVQGKHILITGATSGIGLAAAQALAALGANVAVVGRNETRTRVAAAAIGAAAKAAAVTAFVADLSSQAAVRKLAAEVLARCPRLDVLTVLNLMARTPAVGADTLVWLATLADVANVSGKYFFDRQPRQPSEEALDMQAARRLWELSERQCGL